MNHEIQPPVIKRALGDDWNHLSDVVRQHYDMTPGEASSMVITGVLDEVYHSNIAKLFLLPGRFFGALVPYKGKAVPTEVKNWTSAENKNAMFWHRTMDFSNKPTVTFRSRMEYVQDDEIIEYVNYGMGLRMQVSVDNGALVFKSLGYLWKLGRIKIPIPTWAILGDAEIIERAISDNEFFIDFKMIHPLFGKMFSYSGLFTMQTQSMLRK